MFAYIGSSNEELSILYLALKEAAENDPIAEMFGGESSHEDGWGYVIAGEDGSLHHYRTSKPIYNDLHRIPEMVGGFSAIFHVRKASDKTTIRPAFAHPLLEDNENELLFFAHNGSLEKEPLAKALGFAGITIDSELAAKLYARDGTKCMRLLEKNTKSALNLLIMHINRKTGKAQIYYKKYYVKPEKAEFYDLYYKELDNGRTVYSSTLDQLGLNGEKVIGNGLVPL